MRIMSDEKGLLSKTCGQGSCVCGMAILAVGLVLAAIIFGSFFYNARNSERRLAVIGSATQKHTSDIIKWRMSISRTSDMTGAQAAYAQLEKDLNNLKGYLKSNGIKDEEITVQPISTYPTYDNQGKQSGYNYTQNLFIISRNIPNVEKMALNPKSLSEKNVVIQNSNLSYFFTDLPKIKRELLALATKDANARAAEIAKNAGVKLGKLVSARTGVFSITEPYSNEENSYGSYNTGTRDKDITITMNVSFTVN